MLMVTGVKLAKYGLRTACPRQCSASMVTVDGRKAGSVFVTSSHKIAAQLTSTPPPFVLSSHMAMRDEYL